MYRCRHEQDEDPYASGNENRRRNRNRLNEDIERYNFLRQFRSEDRELPSDRPRGVPAGVCRLGTRRPPSFRPGRPRLGLPLERTLGVLCGPLAFAGLFGPRPCLYLPPLYSNNDDDSEGSDEDEYSPLLPPPPWFGISPFRRRGCYLLPLYGRPHGGQRHRDCYRSYYGGYDAYEDDGCSYMPRPFNSRRVTVKLRRM